MEHVFHLEGDLTSVLSRSACFSGWSPGGCWNCALLLFLMQDFRPDEIAAQGYDECCEIRLWTAESGINWPPGRSAAYQPENHPAPVRFPFSFFRSFGRHFPWPPHAVQRKMQPDQEHVEHLSEHLWLFPYGDFPRQLLSFPELEKGSEFFIISELQFRVFWVFKAYNRFSFSFSKWDARPRIGRRGSNLPLFFSQQLAAKPFFHSTRRSGEIQAS